VSDKIILAVILQLSDPIGTVSAHALPHPVTQIVY